MGGHSNVLAQGMSATLFQHKKEEMDWGRDFPSPRLLFSGQLVFKFNAAIMPEVAHRAFTREHHCCWSTAHLVMASHVSGRILAFLSQLFLSMFPLADTRHGPSSTVQCVVSNMMELNHL